MTDLVTGGAVVEVLGAGEAKLLAGGAFVEVLGAGAAALWVGEVFVEVLTSTGAAPVSSPQQTAVTINT